MNALIFDGRLHLADLPVPIRTQGDALVRVRLAGICGTDLEIVRGYKQFCGVLGHEFVGEVVDCDEPNWMGSRVCGEINIWCGTCPLCILGMRTQCQNRTVVGILGRDGAFAEYIRLPVCNLHRVPDSVSDERAVFVEPLAAAFQVLEQVDFLPGQRVAVLGDGRLGLLCALALAAANVDAVLIGRHDRKLAIARRAGVATLAASASLPANLDTVVEATGSADGIVTAMGLLRPRGTLALKSTTATPASIDLSPIVVKELNVIGSRCGPFGRAMTALEDGSVDPLALVDSVCPLSESIEAMGHAGTSGVLKVLLRP